MRRNALGFAWQRPATAPDGEPSQPPARPVLSLIADHAARRGGATAVREVERTISYAELFGAARHLARRLAARNVGPSSIVAVALPGGIDSVTALLGVLMCGAAYCPLDTTDTHRTLRLLEPVSPAIVLTSSAHATRFGDRQCLLTDPPHPDPQSPVPAVRPSTAPACVIHTPTERLEFTHAALSSLVTSAQHPHFDLDSAGAEIARTLSTLAAGATLTLPQ
ncbi:AMP-binding protein [Streptomyces luteogriseus]|uniref:AMP-binding protein n=1 Tax=Streptomyces luteogriseus TaxID=68233 RepID=UPI0037B41759